MNAPQRVADVLLAAWRSGEQLRELPAELRPITLNDGYDVQDHLVAASGTRRGGWKLGVGSPAQLRVGGLDRPLIGQLDVARLHANGATLYAPATGTLTIECEIGYRIARDIPPNRGIGLQPEDVAEALVTFEIVRSRFIDRRAVGWPSFVADNVGFEALVVGQSIGSGTATAAVSAIDAAVEVFVDGQPTARALSGDAATDPLKSLTALIAHARERRVTLRAGEIVSTGAMCRPFDLKGRGQAIEARYPGGHLVFTV